MRVLKKILFFLLMIFLFFSLTKTIFDYQKNLKFYREYKEDYEKQKKENVALKTEVLKKGGFNEIEKIIRDKLNLARPNELVIIIPSATPTPAAPVTPSIAAYQQWWNLFFKNR